MSTQSTPPAPPIPPRVRDLTGQTFDRLTVLEFAGYVQAATQRHAAWRCRCVCGGERVYRAQVLQNGRAKSCGCLQRDRLGDHVRKHGMFRSPEYAVWQNMKKRCFDTAYRRYPGYGGRGIAVCERWRDSFDNFIADMGRRPSPKHSIERKDNDGHYCPENCVWATRPQQDSNKRTNRLVTFNGETLTVKEWSRRTGINHETLRHRLLIGWTPERALTTPPKAIGRGVNAQRRSVTE